MFFAEIYDSIRGRIDCRQKIKPKSDRLLGAGTTRPPSRSDAQHGAARQLARALGRRHRR
jgi:hypothetical protein